MFTSMCLFALNIAKNFDFYSFWMFCFYQVMYLNYLCEMWINLSSLFALFSDLIGIQYLLLRLKGLDLYFLENFLESC